MLHRTVRATIYLHWAATPYTWLRSGLYHTIISGDGRLHRLHDYTIDLPSHTWRRNSNAIAISCACMGGRPDPWSLPPTAAQLKALCEEVARVASSWGWSASDITIQRVMTHAEAASNRDGRVMHDNYGPVIWGGTGERWDFLQLEKGGAADGGDQLRARIRKLMQNSGSAGEKEAGSQLRFKRSTTMQARGQTLTVDLDEHGISWALAADLLERYELPFDWDAERQRILVGSFDVTPGFQEDQVQPSVGWPLVEMALQSGNNPVILRGIPREQRAWCRVLEFAEAFGISTSFEPFTLLERRGG